VAQTPTTMSSVLKERWTSDRLQKQFLSDDSLLSRFEGFESTMIGRQAQTPVWSDLNSGGFTQIGAGGGAINTATNQSTAQAVWTLNYAYFPIALEFSTLNQANDSNLQSIISGKNLEIEGAMTTLRRQLTRQIVTNGDSIVAQCATGGASATISLIASPSGTSWGYDAIVRNWLRPGAVIDVGTTADTDSLITAGTVTAVAESASAPTITTATSVSTTSGTHFVYIANPNSATAANPEVNGLRNMVNTTGALGALNPATAGQEFWASPARDTSTTVFSLDLLLNLSRGVKQKSGKPNSETWMGFKQEANFWSLLQNQVRYAGERDLSAGGQWGSVQWGGTTTKAYADILDSDVWCVTPEDLIRITGSYTKPVWMTDVYGQNGQLAWHQGNTDGQDVIAYGVQFGCQRRNTHSGATALTA
jgi:hypothetical protein